MSVQTTTPSVGDLETAIRDVVNRPRIRHSFAQHVATWNMLCSSLDVIGDAAMAIASYIASDDPEDTGLRYLFLYGILQALFIQQDAMENLLRGLGVQVPDTIPDLEYVREIRNKATGHPTMRERRPKRGVPQTSHFVSRFSLGKQGFKLLNCDEHGRDQFEDVDIEECIRRHQACIGDQLKRAAEELRQREVAHRMRFKDQKLSAIVSGQMSYHLEKVTEACHGGPDRRMFGALNLDFLVGQVEKFVAALEERGVLPASDFLAHDLEELRYPMQELKKYLDGEPTNTLNPRSSYIFAFFVRDRLLKLVKVAEDLDDEYAAEVPE
jgi:hypothetical protein